MGISHSDEGSVWDLCFYCHVFASGIDSSVMLSDSQSGLGFSRLFGQMSINTMNVDKVLGATEHLYF